jgi:hypothetical protein
MGIHRPRVEQDRGERCESLTSDRQLSSRLADVGHRAASSSGMRPNSPQSEPTLGVGRA